MKIILSEQDVSNLKIFLGRLQLTGNEVPAYSKILQAIYRAETEANVEAKKTEITS